MRVGNSSFLTVERLDSRETLVPPPVLVEHALQIHGEERVGRSSSSSSTVVADAVDVFHLFALLYLSKNCLWNGERNRAVSS